MDFFLKKALYLNQICIEKVKKSFFSITELINMEAMISAEK